jgi:hypothetical protein
MSAIMETESGGEMICILGFSARPRGLDDQPVPGERRSFRVGERVRYVTFFYKKTPKDNPTGYMAVFEPLDLEDENRYAASESYFVTLDCWEGLRKHFASTLRTDVGTKSVAKRPKNGPSKRVAAKFSAKPALPQMAREPDRGKRSRKDA